MKVNWVEIDNIKSFKEPTKVNLNNDYNFVVGTNGSGKTTLFQILSSCLLIIIPQYKPQHDSQNSQKKIRFNYTPHNVLLPSNYRRKTDPQKILLEISIADSIKGLKEEFKSYIEIFEQNKEFINENFWVEENFFETINSVTTSLNSLKDYVFTFEFNVEGNEINQTSKSIQENNIVIEAFKIIEKLRTIYNHLFVLGKVNELVKKSFRVLYLGSDRQPSFPTEISINRSNIEDYVNNSSYGKDADLVSTIYSSNNFDFIGQTLLRIGEQVLRRIWQQHDNDPLKSIKEFTELQSVLKKILGIDFNAVVPSLPFEPMKLEFSKDGFKVDFNQLSSGEKSLVFFIFTLTNPEIKNSFILVDEAEIHLHGNMQASLLEIIFEKSFNNQHFFSTHSPNLINKATIDSVLRFFKENSVTKYVNFRTDTGKKSAYEITRLINSQNNEKIFFADKVVLVEGIKDRIFFESILRSLSKKYNIEEIIEVIDVGGKLNLALYKSYLDDIEVKNYIIADFDYLFDLKKKELGNLVEINTKKVDELIKGKKSEDRLSLIIAIEEYIEENKKQELLDVVTYLKSRGVKVKDTLNTADMNVIITSISELSQKQIHIISQGALSDKSKYTGEVEDYLIHLNPSKKVGDLVNTLVAYTNKDDFLEDLITKNDPLITLELLSIVCAIMFDNKDKGSEVLKNLQH